MVTTILALILNAIFCSAFATTADTFLLSSAMILAAAIMRQGHETNSR